MMDNTILNIATYQRAACMIEAMLRFLAETNGSARRNDLIASATKEVEIRFNIPFEKSEHLAGRCITFCKRKNYIQSVGRGLFQMRSEGMMQLNNYQHKSMATAYRAFVHKGNHERAKAKTSNKVVQNTGQSNIEMICQDYKTVEGWVNGVNGRNEHEGVLSLKKNIHSHAADMNNAQRHLYAIRILEFANEEHNCSRLSSFRSMMLAKYRDNRSDFDSVNESISRIADKIKQPGQSQSPLDGIDLSSLPEDKRTIAQNLIDLIDSWKD